jgi:hypothetical protein
MLINLQAESVTAQRSQEWYLYAKGNIAHTGIPAQSLLKWQFSQNSLYYHTSKCTYSFPGILENCTGIITLLNYDDKHIHVYSYWFMLCYLSLWQCTAISFALYSINDDVRLVTTLKTDKWEQLYERTLGARLVQELIKIPQGMHFFTFSSLTLFTLSIADFVQLKKVMLCYLNIFHDACSHLSKVQPNINAWNCILYNTNYEF